MIDDVSLGYGLDVKHCDMIKNTYKYTYRFDSFPTGVLADLLGYF
jgi:hypothetical protein